jgi:ATP adenylyltransferase
MSYESLANFITGQMRMSHIYQPVMLMELLERGGKCNEREIASSLLAHDESQIEYYIEITNNMVGRVLRNRGAVQRDKQTKTYQLGGSRRNQRRAEAAADRNVPSTSRCFYGSPW